MSRFSVKHNDMRVENDDRLFIFVWLFFKAEYQTVSDVRVSNQRRTNCLLNVEPAWLLTTLAQWKLHHWKSFGLFSTLELL